MLISDTVSNREGVDNNPQHRKHTHTAANPKIFRKFTRYFYTLGRLMGKVAKSFKPPPARRAKTGDSLP